MPTSYPNMVQHRYHSTGKTIKPFSSTARDPETRHTGTCTVKPGTAALNLVWPYGTVQLYYYLAHVNLVVHLQDGRRGM